MTIDNISVYKLVLLFKRKEILYWRNKFCVRFFNLENVSHVPLPSYASQIIITFLSLMISANHDKVEGFLVNREILKPLIVSLL